ncbi:MAG: hypothetical protein U0836_02660 [Pirellulales bacterium]
MAARRLILVAVALLAGLQSPLAQAEWSLWPWGKTEPAKSSRPQPSTWSKMSTGTKQMWSKTVDAVTPDSPSPHRKASMTTRKAPSQKSRKKKGWINSWFGSNEKEGPQTVNEFLKQPRPEF